MGKRKEAFTPPPWKWHHRSKDQEHEGSVYSEQREGMAYAVAIMPRYQSREQWEADARLIAAAPDLYEALDNLVRFFKGYQGMEMKQARAALKRAEQKEGE